MNGRIADVLRAKGSTVYSIDADAMVDLAVERMTTLHVGSLLVLDRDKPVGILAERDVLRRIVYMDRDPHATPVSAVMTPDPLAVKASASIADTMRAMTVHRCRHLPVVEEHKVIGLVSIGDLTSWVTRELEGQLSEFARYIHGQYISDSVAPPAEKKKAPEISDSVDSTMAL